MPRCLNCKDKFVAKRFLQKHCEKEECVDASVKYAMEKSKALNEKKIKDDWKKEKKEIKEKIKTLTDWNNELQKEINLIVRLIDHGHPCMSSQRPLGKSFDAGHIYSRGGNPQIRFHLFNIFAQSVHDNQWKSGNQLEFVDGIEKTFGTELKDYCLSLKGLPELRLSKEEISEKISTARGIVKWLRLQDREFTTQERISLRHKFQEQLGIHK